MAARDPIEDDRTFLERHGVKLGVGVVLLLVVGGVLAFYFLGGKAPAPRKPEEIMVHLLPPPLPPPPPPPPPPPKIPPPPQPKMVEQPKVEKPEPPKPKLEAKVDRPPAPGPKASGPPSDDGIGGGGGDGIGGNGGDGGGKFDFYAVMVQQQVAEALRDNSATRAVSLKVKVRIWSDANGHVTRAELAGSSGDPAVDAAIKNQVLLGLQLREPPPQDMPMPIVMMIREQRPS